MVFSVGPVPITSAIGLFVVIFRPIWFKKLVDTIYADKNGWLFVLLGLIGQKFISLINITNWDVYEELLWLKMKRIISPTRRM